MSARSLGFYFLPRVLLAGLALCAVCGCTTTGDPTKGGLFGWSEAKAQQRIAEKELRLASERGALARERRTTGALGREQTTNRRRIGQARVEADERAETERQQAELAAIEQNAATLEREAPTPAGASRARHLRAEISRVENDKSLSANERWQALHSLDTAVTQLRSQLGIQSR